MAGARPIRIRTPPTPPPPFPPRASGSAPTRSMIIRWRARTGQGREPPSPPPRPQATGGPGSPQGPARAGGTGPSATRASAPPVESRSGRATPDDRARPVRTFPVRHTALGTCVVPQAPPAARFSMAARSRASPLTTRPPSAPAFPAARAVAALLLHGHHRHRLGRDGAAPHRDTGRATAQGRWPCVGRVRRRVPEPGKPRPPPNRAPRSLSSEGRPREPLPTTRLPVRSAAGPCPAAGAMARSHGRCAPSRTRRRSIPGSARAEGRGARDVRRFTLRSPSATGPVAVPRGRGRGLS